MTAELELRPYDLPDADLLEPHERGARLRVFVPQRVLVVIGRGSDPALEVRADTVREDGVPVLRRGSGGCAVVLTPQMVCVSFAFYGEQQGKSADYFRGCNDLIIRALERCGVDGLEHAGISDIARRGRKISGSALYRNRLLVFYHVVINLGGSSALIERYLRHPPRTPDYRNGRAHEEFVTSLAAEGYAVDAALFKHAIEELFQSLTLLKATPFENGIEEGTDAAL
jgi:lipoate-protein ligase A